MHSSNFLCSVHRLKLSEIKGAGGLVEPMGDSAGLSEIERILCRFEAWDNRLDTGTVSMKPGTNKLVVKARLEVRMDLKYLGMDMRKLENPCKI